MRVTCHELIGKRVIDADGRAIGRIADLVAERQGEALCVTTLLVGETGLVRRIGFRRSTLWHLAPPREVPWRMVARIADAVHLSVDCRAVDALPRDTDDRGDRLIREREEQRA